MQPPGRDTEDQAPSRGGSEGAGGPAQAVSPEHAAPPEHAMAPEHAIAPQQAAARAVRASDRERDAATHRLQEAFGDGRLDDAEFDERMRAALTARTCGQLDELLTDLPCS